MGKIISENYQSLSKALLERHSQKSVEGNDYINILIPDSDKYEVFTMASDKDSMTFEGGQLKYADVTKMVAKLTDFEKPSNGDMETFLLTYRNFVSPEMLLTLLGIRFKDIPKNYPENLALTLQLRVCEFIDKWVQLMPLDFCANSSLAMKCLALIESMEAAAPSALRQSCTQLKSEVGRRRADYEPATPEGAPRTAKLPKVIGKLTDIDPEEVARQLTIEEYEQLKRIQGKELCNLTWCNAGMETLTPRVGYFVVRFSDMYKWVISLVLSEKDIGKRKKIIKHLVKVCKECLKLNNYNTCMEIYTALKSNPILRLKKSWGKHSLETLKDLSELTENNYRVLEERISKCEGPVIPFVGLLLSQLLVAEQGVPNFNAIGQMNWEKAQLMEEAIKGIVKNQNGKYHLLKSQAVLEWLNQSISTPKIILKDALDVSQKLEKPT